MYPSASGAPYHHHHLHHHQFQHATHNMLPHYSTAPPAAQQQQQQVLLAPPPSPPHAAPASYAPLQLVHSHFPSQHLLQPPQPHVATPSSSFYPSTLINTTPQLHPLMDNITSNVVHFIPSSSSYTPPSASLYNSATVPSSSTALGVTSSSSSPHSNIVPQQPPSPFTFYVTPTYAPNPNHASSPPSMLVMAASQPEAPVTYNASNMTVYAARPPPPSAVGWGSDSTPSMFTTPSNTVPNFSLAYVDSSANASPADPALTVTPGGSATTPSTPVVEGVKGLTFSASKQKRSSKPIVLPLALPGNTQGCLQLVVHYLAPDITEAALQQLFEATVPGCSHARIAIDPTTGRSRGFGYVWYSTQQDAIRAMEETNGRVLSRKRIRVLFASPQSEPW